MRSYRIMRGTAGSKDPGVALKVEIELEGVSNFFVHDGSWGAVPTFISVVLVREKSKEMLILITKRQDNQRAGRGGA